MLLRYTYPTSAQWNIFKTLFENFRYASDMQICYTHMLLSKYTHIYILCNNIIDTKVQISILLLYYVLEHSEDDTTRI